MSEDSKKAKPGSNADADPEIRVLDRRFWVRKDWDAQERSKTRAPTVVEQLQSQISQGNERIQEIREAARQMQAETEAVRSRLERDVERKLSTARGFFIVDMLEVLDNLERFLQVAQQGPGQDNSDPAFRSLVEGVNMVRLLFIEKLQRQGVEKIAVLGQRFNPESAEAIELVQTDYPEQDNQVVNVFQDGYQMNGKTLRPARVRVARSAKSPEQGTEPKA